jgi:hypothetical protein
LIECVSCEALLRAALDEGVVSSPVRSVACGLEDADLRKTVLACDGGGQQARDVHGRLGGQEIPLHELPVAAIAERVIQLSESPRCQSTSELCPATLALAISPRFLIKRSATRGSCRASWTSRDLTS